MRTTLLIILVGLATVPAAAQQVSAGAEAPGFQGTPPPLQWSAMADIRGVYIGVTAVGREADGRSSLEQAVLAAHHRLLRLVDLEPSYATTAFFEKHLVIENERVLPDGAVEVRVAMALPDFALMASGLPEEDEAPQETITLPDEVDDVDAAPLMPSPILPVEIGPDGAVSPLGAATEPDDDPGDRPVIARSLIIPDPEEEPDVSAEATAFNQQGLDAATLGQTETAIEAFEKSLEASRTGMTARDAHVNLGALLFQQKKYAEAAGHYQAALNEDPDHALARYGMGSTLQAVGQTQLAVQQFLACLELQPTGTLADWTTAALIRLGYQFPAEEDEEEGVPPAVTR